MALVMIVTSICEVTSTFVSFVPRAYLTRTLTRSETHWQDRDGPAACTLYVRISVGTHAKREERTVCSLMLKVMVNCC